MYKSQSTCIDIITQEFPVSSRHIYAKAIWVSTLRGGSNSPPYDEHFDLPGDIGEGMAASGVSLSDQGVTGAIRGPQAHLPQVRDGCIGVG